MGKRSRLKEGGISPKEGPIVLASNHFGYFDPFLLVHGIRKPIDFIMQKELGIEPHFLFAPK